MGETERYLAFEAPADEQNVPDSGYFQLMVHADGDHKAYRNKLRAVVAV